MLTLPIVHVVADTLPEAWEKAVIETWRSGREIPTQYDRPGDPPSRDATALIVVRNPHAEPRIHRALPGGFADLEVYRQEVVDGVHDHWIDPEAGKWEYTYHERLTAYRAPGLEQPVNQLDGIVEALARAPHTRRAQAVMWQPFTDTGIADPPCLQRLWMRVFDDELVLSCDMRSNDAYKAAFMNMYAFTDLQRAVAERLSGLLGRTIRPGQYTHYANSFHIYGSYFGEFEQFLALVEKRPYERRVIATADVQDILDEAAARLRASLAEEKATGRKGV